MRIVHQLIMTIADDTLLKDVLFSRETDRSKVTIDTYTQSIAHGFTVPDTETLALTLGDLPSPAKGLYLEVDADCDVKLSGSTDPIQLRIASGGSKAKLFLEANVTSVTVEANQSSAVTGTYAAWA